MQNSQVKVDSASAATAPPPKPSAPRDANVASRDEPPHAQRTEQPAQLGRIDNDTESTPRTVNSALQDGVDSLAAQIGSLGIDATVPHDADPIPLRIVRESGEPADDVQFCPGSRSVNYSSKWYYIAAIPESAGATLTCTRCYQDHIAHTALADKWTSLVIDEGTTVMCNFYVTRVKKILWPQAVQANSMVEISALLARSAGFQPCPGQEAVTGVEGHNLTCYEKYVADSPFEDKFAPDREKAEEHTWTCSMRDETVGRIATFAAERNDWQAFVDGARERLQLPPCAGAAPVPSDSCGWYLARGALRAAPVCATCYRDHLATTPFAERSRKYAPGLDRFPSPGAAWACSLASLGSLAALEGALAQRDWRILEETLKNMVEAPACAEQGIVGGSWWTLAGGGCPGFALCYACFAGIFWMRGLDGFLEPAAAPAGEAVKCSFHPSHPRFAQYWSKMCKTVDRGVFSYFADYVRTMSTVRPCAHNGGFANAKWWGYSDSLFCEDCYLTYVKNTALGPHLELNGSIIPETSFCQIWSPRMRHYWEEVCAAGGPGTPASDKSLEDFLGVSRHRRKTYFETLSEIETMKQLKEVQRRRALFDAQLSVQWQGIDGMSRALGSRDHYQYGNDTLGWYDSSAGYEARVLFGRFTEGLLASQLKPSELQRILVLQAIWKEVE
ncbi:hypothetical protein PWT90_02461 [Aphanocladium album]|nr:hypothetical protein PWT90_02461 [Aphanocladium album]